MYLRNRPVNYTNGEQVIAVHYTAHARDLEADGWTQVETVELQVPEPVAQEPVGEAVLAETDLSSLTKNELVSYAEEIGVELKGNPTKSEILNLIKTQENG